MSRRSLALLLLAGTVLWAVLTVLQVQVGEAARFSFSLREVGIGLARLFGNGEGLEPAAQAVFELRVWRGLTAAGVGACLAVSGAMLQGLFRNGLAEPALLGVSGGANLGATLALLALYGYARGFVPPSGVGAGAFVTAMAFAGALATSLLVLVIARGDGQIDVVRLLLVGVAMNTVILGVLAAMYSLLLHDAEVSRAVRTWTFGNLDDRQPVHAAMVCAGVLVAAAAIPFVATELDLLAGGEEDAAALGVSTGSVKVVVTLATAFATACAFAAAGQIAFVGLLVPHVLRLLTGASHRTLLPLSLVAGAVVLLGLDLAQLAVLGKRTLHTGVLMSVVGGPFFLALLARAGRLGSW
ncbi:MAG TPA: iron ABC transporter permease [Planctomycetota bacterium]|nr:iron ABC transporter permease [Planctomycetota bacterium]